MIEFVVINLCHFRVVYVTVMGIKDFVEGWVV